MRIDLKKYLHDKQAIRFLIVGILNTIVGYGTYYIIISFNISYVIAMTISQIVGVTHSFFWNKFWTFKSKKSGRKEIFKFVSVYLVTYVMNLTLLAFFIEIMKIDKRVAPIIILFITTLISYFGHKFWSFR